MNRSKLRRKKTKRITKYNTVEVFIKLNNICEQTYEFKKDYYEKRLDYLRRSVEAQEND